MMKKRTKPRLKIGDIVEIKGRIKTGIFGYGEIVDINSKGALVATGLFHKWDYFGVHRLAGRIPLKNLKKSKITMEW